MPLNLDHAVQFMSRLAIRDRERGVVVPFRLRPQQREVIESGKAHLAARRRLYLISLKARRVGISPLAAGFLTSHCVANPAASAGIIAQNKKVAQANFDMACGFKEDLQPIYHAYIKPTKTVLTFQHDDGKPSNISHHTAATVYGSRGLTFSALHLTEAAFYPYEGVFTSLMNTLSSDPNNICLVETTANGMEGPGQAFYEYWEAAVGGDNEFLPIFLPWYGDPDYVLDPDLAADAPRDDYEKWLMTGIKDWKTGKKVKIGKDRIAWFRD